MRLDFCVACGYRGIALNHHHLVPASRGGTDDETNVITLCLECHGRLHQRPQSMHWGYLQMEGIAKAKAAGKYRGRREDIDRNAGIAGMLRSGMSWSAIQAAAGCSRGTIAKIAKRHAGRLAGA